uniref:PBPe domain-containing protein n=1 Tax=Macrostomum lignano TaxID=282301 RepID=A0A1I8GHG1_9PLAT
MSLLYTEEPPDAWEEIFLFSQPYDIYTWLGVLGATATTAVVVTTLASNQAEQCQLRPVAQFVLRLLVFVRGPRQGRLPNKPATRVLVGAFWLFSLVVLINYAARLGAQLVLRRIQVDLSALQNLPKQTAYRYGTLGDSSFSIVFRNSSFMYMRSIYTTMAHAALAGEICNAHLSAYFQNYEVAFAIPQLSELRDLVSGEIVRLKAAGEVKRIYDSYFTVSPKDRPDCRTSTTWITDLVPAEPPALAPRKGALTLLNCLGIFLVNLVGCTAAVLAALMERCWSTVLYRYRELRSAEAGNDGQQKRRRSTLHTVLTSIYSSSEA